MLFGLFSALEGIESSSLESPGRLYSQANDLVAESDAYLRFRGCRRRPEVVGRGEERTRRKLGSGESEGGPINPSQEVS